MTEPSIQETTPHLSPAILKMDLMLIAETENLEAIPEDPRLIEDLDLDSLAMAEVIVLLEDKYGLQKRRMDYLTRDWRGVAVSQLFEECCQVTNDPSG